MRRLLVLVALDGRCALAAPLLAPVLLQSPQVGPLPETAYAEVAGVCVEETERAELGGRPVAMSFCEGA